ncbi:MAG: amidophosphoribosyltransferase [Muribaculaceae bacterium]|nr:amidophosphoribosyltransferase [Muribaculaceae bacterium]
MRIKHECGIALIRLLKPLSHYKEKYGTELYGLNKLYQIMVKELNRGQDGAGIGCVNVRPEGHSEFFIEKALGYGAIDDIFTRVRADISATRDSEGGATPFLGNIYMGHLRYSTTGRSGIDYVHPFLRDTGNSASRLLLCGNFNMTNADELIASQSDPHARPEVNSDTTAILSQLGKMIESLESCGDATRDVELLLKSTANTWDGGFAMCGITGRGDTFVIRDSHGIRPAFYYHNDEILVIASERPVIMTAMGIDFEDVHEVPTGSAVIVDPDGNISVRRILPALENARCAFEHIYFSRSNDPVIYRERKLLGRALAPRVARAINRDWEHTIFTFVPDTAETAFLGMMDELGAILNRDKLSQMSRLDRHSPAYWQQVEHVLSQRLHTEKIVVKDLKKRIFITQDDIRGEVASHAFDVTYGQVNAGVDTLVVIDDSIVRGTTLKQTILRILDRLHPRRIVFISTSPQVRYPDFYGIDMSRLAEFTAFNAAIGLLHDHKMDNVIDDVYRRCKLAIDHGVDPFTNHVKGIYAPIGGYDLSDRIAALVKDDNIQAELKIIFQSVDALHAAVPGNTGDWYFTGNYPTPGGVKLVNKAFINWYEGRTDARS